MAVLVPFVERQDLAEECIKLLNEEWPKSETVRKMSLGRSASPDPPMAFVLLDNDNLVGFARFLQILNYSDGRAALFDTVVISKSLRGRGLGHLLMDLLRDEAKRRGFTLLIICTTDKETFYEKCGYKRCKFLHLVTKITPNSEQLVASMSFDRPIPIDIETEERQPHQKTECSAPAPPPLPMISKSRRYKDEQYMFMYC